MLTNKRKAWAQARGAALKGHPLRYNAGDQAKYAAALDKLTRQMTEQVEKEIRRLFETDAAGAHFAQDATIASQARITVNSLADTFTSLFNVKAKMLAANMVDTASSTSSKALHSSLKQLSGGLSLKTSLVTGKLQEVTKAAVVENVGLIKSIASQFLQKVEGAVMRSITTGNGLQDLIPELQKLSGQTHRKARNIALDQTRKVYNSINRDRMTGLGLKKFTWHHSGGGADPREAHVEMDGNVYSFDDLPVIDERTGERGIPGQAINCFPEYSNVEFPNGINKLFRRWYSGELISIVADNGVILEATPNHPVLTQRGWLPLKSIDEGDYLVSCGKQALGVGQTNIDDFKTTFGNVFDSSLNLFFESRTASAGSAFQFHGDGSDQEIDIVFVDLMLPREADSVFCQNLCKFVLSFADIYSAADFGFHDSSLNQLIMSTLGSSNSFVRSAYPLLSLLCAKSACGNDIRGGLSTYLNTRFNESSSDSRSGNPEIFRKLELAKSGNVSRYDIIIREILSASRFADGVSWEEPISAEKLGECVRIDFENFGDLIKAPGSVKQFNRIIKKSLREFSGFVHNAETPGNWYIVNGYIIHNCGCFMSPYFDFEENAG